MAGVFHTPMCVSLWQVCSTPLCVWACGRCVPHPYVCEPVAGVFHTPMCVSLWQVCSTPLCVWACGRCVPHPNVCEPVAGVLHTPMCVSLWQVCCTPVCVSLQQVCSTPLDVVWAYGICSNLPYVRLLLKTSKQDLFTLWHLRTEWTDLEMVEFWK